VIFLTNFGVIDSLMLLVAARMYMGWWWATSELAPLPTILDNARCYVCSTGPISLGAARFACRILLLLFLLLAPLLGPASRLLVLFSKCVKSFSRTVEAGPFSTIKVI
jgi:hypothetical protein